MLDDLQAFCEAATKDHPQIRVSQIRLLVAVAQYSPQGITMTALANECEVTLAAVSRAYDVWGEGGRIQIDENGNVTRSTPGRGFMTHEDQVGDERPKLLRLTEAGIDYLMKLRMSMN